MCPMPGWQGKGGGGRQSSKDLGSELCQPVQGVRSNCCQRLCPECPLYRWARGGVLEHGLLPWCRGPCARLSMSAEQVSASGEGGVLIRTTQKSRSGSRAAVWLGQGSGVPACTATPWWCDLCALLVLLPARWQPPCPHLQNAAPWADALQGFADEMHRRAQCLVPSARVASISSGVSIITTFNCDSPSGAESHGARRRGPAASWDWQGGGWTVSNRLGSRQMPSSCREVSQSPGGVGGLCRAGQGGWWPRTLCSDGRADGKTIFFSRAMQPQSLVLPPSTAFPSTIFIFLFAK